MFSSFFLPLWTLAYLSNNRSFDASSCSTKSSPSINLLQQILCWMKISWTEVKEELEGRFHLGSEGSKWHRECVFIGFVLLPLPWYSIRQFDSEFEELSRPMGWIRRHWRVRHVSSTIPNNVQSIVHLYRIILVRRMRATGTEREREKADDDNNDSNYTRLPTRPFSIIFVFCVSRWKEEHDGGADALLNNISTNIHSDRISPWENEELTLNEFLPVVISPQRKYFF